jgi:hypothetical protein
MKRFSWWTRSRPRRRSASRRSRGPRSFDDLVSGRFPLTIAVNGLDRSMGLPGPYPFVLAPPAVEKPRFVHEVCC